MRNSGQDEIERPEDGASWGRYLLLGVVLAAAAAALALSFNVNPELGTRFSPADTPGPAPQITGLPVSRSDRDFSVTLDSVERVGRLVTVRFWYDLAEGSGLGVERLEAACSRPDTGDSYTWEGDGLGEVRPGAAVSRVLIDVPVALRALDIDFDCRLRPPLERADVSFDVPMPGPGGGSPLAMEFPGGRFTVNKIAVRPELDVPKPAHAPRQEYGFTIDIDVWLDDPLPWGESAALVTCTDTDGRLLPAKQMSAVVTGAQAQYAVQLEASGLAGPPPPMVRLHLYARKTADDYRRRVRFAGVAISEAKMAR
jgi:hypothetical protein